MSVVGTPATKVAVTKMRFEEARILLFVLSMLPLWAAQALGDAKTHNPFVPAPEAAIESLDLPPINTELDIQRDFVLLDDDAINEGLIKPWLNDGTTAPIQISLPDGTTVTLNTDQLIAVYKNEEPTISLWSGSVEESILSGFSFIGLDDGTLIGDIVIESRVYRIRKVSGITGLYQIIKPLVGTASGAAEPIPDSDHNAVAPVSDVLEDFPPDYIHTIDIAVFYTSAAALAAPKYLSGEIEDEIALAIAEINISFRNQNIPAELRLVRTQEIEFEDGRPIDIGSIDRSKIGDLDRLINPSDGVADDVHQIRNEARADLVSLWVDASTNSTCGQASIYRGDPEIGSSRAFSIVSVYCAKRYNSFAHEVGHNLGAGHDGPSSSGRYGDSRGYVLDAAPNTPKVATISSRGYACRECFRAVVWSDPDYRRAGLTWGQENISNNRRTLIESVGDVAAFSDYLDLPESTEVASVFGASNIVPSRIGESPFGALKLLDGRLLDDDGDNVQRVAAEDIYNRGSTERSNSDGVRFLVIHATAGSSIEGLLSITKTGRAGIHYAVDRDGSIWSVSDLSRAAFHIRSNVELDGFTQLSHHSHAVTLVNDLRSGFPPEQLGALVALTRALDEEFQYEKIVSHQELEPERRTDPGPFFPWNEFIEQVEN